MDFIYELKEYIYSFGNGEDKRIHEIRSKNIITDGNYLIKASKRIENILKYASIDLKNDPELVTKILRKRYYLIDQVGEKLKDSMDFMWPIIKKDPMFIRNAGNNIRKHRCVGLLVTRYSLDAFRYMNISLLNDPIFIEYAKKIPGFEKKYILSK